MPGIVWRILIALVCFLAFNAMMPPLMRIIGLSMSGDVETVVRICVGLLFLGYIFWGRWPGTPVAP